MQFLLNAALSLFLFAIVLLSACFSLLSADPANEFKTRVGAHPKEGSAFQALARAQTEANEYDAASSVNLSGDRGDRDALLRLARLQWWRGNFGESIRLYRAALEGNENDTDTMEALARVYVSAQDLRSARKCYQTLAAINPVEPRYSIALARLDLELAEYVEARETLASLLALYPANAEARLLLAQLQSRTGNFRAARKNFDLVVKQEPENLAAVFGAARMSYFLGDFRRASELANELVSKTPNDFDAIFLLASVEHARGRRARSKHLLLNAEKISPNNPDAEHLREAIREETAVTFHSSATWAHEVFYGRLAGHGEAWQGESLRTSTFTTRVGFSFLPRSVSALLFDYLPSSFPGSYTRTAAPTQFMFQNSATVTQKLKVRAGLGAVRFATKPGDFLTANTGLFEARSLAPAGFGGFSFAPNKKVSLDLNWSATPVLYTPVSVNLGVVERRLEGGLNFFLDPRTEAHVDYFRGSYQSARVQRTEESARGQGVQVFRRSEKGRGGGLTLSRGVFDSKLGSLRLGYSGRAFGFQGAASLGFFSPGFYQRHLATAELRGKFPGPFSYNLKLGAGFQQAERHRPIRRAIELGPAVSLRVSRHISFTLGYTHYTSAETPGSVRGDSIQISTDCKF